MKEHRKAQLLQVCQQTVLCIQGITCQAMVSTIRQPHRWMVQQQLPALTHSPSSPQRYAYSVIPRTLVGQILLRCGTGVLLQQAMFPMVRQLAEQSSAAVAVPALHVFNAMTS